MSRDVHRLSQYLPTAEEYPEDTTVKGTTVASGTDSNLVRTPGGQLVLTNKNNQRRGN